MVGFYKCVCGSQVQVGRRCTNCRRADPRARAERFVQLAEHPTHPCGAKCQFAKGDDCACQCEGLNHGIANRYGGNL